MHDETALRSRQSAASQKSLILVVAGNGTLAEVLVSTLRATGYQAVVAHSGQECSEFLQSSAPCSPDLLILEAQLKDTSGDLWLESQRKAGMNSPVVFIAEENQDVSVLKSLSCILKLDLILQQPIVPANFIDEVRGLLAGRQEPAYTKFSGQFKKRLSDAKANYRQQLPTYLRELQSKLMLFKNNLERPQALEDALFACHKLCGTSGAFEYQEVSNALSFIEDVLIKFTEDGRPPDSECRWKAIEKSIEYCLARVEVVVSEPSESHIDRPILSPISLYTVLVVDSDGELTELVERCCKHRLATVLRAQTTNEAIQLCHARTPTIAIINSAFSDGEIPMNLPSELRAVPRLSKLPIAMVSQSSGLHNRMAAIHSGVSLFAHRALTQDRVEHLLCELLEQLEPEPYRIMLVDDDPSFLDFATSMLTAQGFVVESLVETFSVFESMKAFQPDLLVLDIGMPGFTGFDVCRMLRNSLTFRDLPVLFITSHANMHSRLAAFEAGGDDYLPKGLIQDELLVRVKIRIARSKHQRELLRQDQLTQCPRKDLFLDRLQLLGHQAGGRLQLVVLNVVDLDVISRMHGYLAYEDVLSTVGSIISARFRPKDLRCHWDRGKFALAILDETRSVVEGAVAQLCWEFAQITFQDRQGQTFSSELAHRVLQMSKTADLPQKVSEILEERL